MKVIDNRSKQSKLTFNNLSLGHVFYHKEYPDLGYYMKISLTSGKGDSWSFQHDGPAHVGNNAELVLVKATLTIES